MSPFVLDNSVTMRWCFEHSATLYSPQQESIITEAMKNGQSGSPEDVLDQALAAYLKRDGPAVRLSAACVSFDRNTSSPSAASASRI